MRGTADTDLRACNAQVGVQFCILRTAQPVHRSDVLATVRGRDLQFHHGIENTDSTVHNSQISAPQHQAQWRSVRIWSGRPRDAHKPVVQPWFIT